jgi:hypothetical protein
MTTDLLTIAAEWVITRGVSVFPLKVRSKEPEARLLPRDDTGRPGWQCYRDRLPTLEELACWWGKGICWNLAVITGRGLVVLDFDEPGGYECWQALYPQADTYTVTTSRGRHVYVYLDNPPDRTIHTFWGEVRTAGAYVVGEGSIHPTGTQYVGNGREIARFADLDAILSPALLIAKTAEPVQVGAPAVYAAVPMPAAVGPRDVWTAASSPPEGDPISRIKKHYKILDFFPDAKPSGRGYYLAHCPFHQDNHPSFWILPHRNIGGCYAGCNGGKPFDVINLAAHFRKTDIRGAVDYLVNQI